MKNLILGYCVGLQNEDIRVFCESALDSASSPTEIIIFATGEFECRKESEFASLTFIPAGSIWQGIKKDRYRVRWAATYFATKALRISSKLQRCVFSLLFGGAARTSDNRENYYLHPALARYLHYLEFLVSNSDKYRNVLISDVRDVYFQSDPFAGQESFELTSFLEPGGITCSEERNHRWINAVYGAKVASCMENQRVVCSGVSLGSTAAMLDYLRKMCGEILDKSVIPYSDQGIHNVLIWRNSFDIRILENRDALALTAGIDSAGNDFRIEDDRILSVDGVPFRIVHQFDRHTELDNVVKRQLSSRCPPVIH